MKPDTYFLQAKNALPPHDLRVQLPQKDLETLVGYFGTSKYQPFAKIMTVVIKSIYGRKTVNKEIAQFSISEFREYFIWKESLDNPLVDTWVDHEVKTEYISVLTHMALWDKYANIETEIEWMYEALSINPESPQAQYNLGHLYRRSNKLNRAITHYKMSLIYDPKWVDNYLELGIIYKDQKRNKLAVEVFEKGLRVKKCPKIMNELGVLYSLTNQKDKARQLFDDAMKIMKEHPEEYNKILEATLWINFGYLHSNVGEIQESLNCYEKAMILDPTNQLAFQNYLLNSNYLTIPAEKIYKKHLEYGKAITNMCKKVDFNPPLNQYSGGVIKLGYVSGDFWGHAVSFFTEALLKNCNLNRFEIYCYSNGELNHNSISKYDPRIHWKSIKHLDTYNAAKLISGDQLHVLIDLAGHTSNNRLDVFAYRLAPVQMTYLGYPNTTGMKEIDYRIVDGVSDVNTLASETLVKLDCFLCYHNPLNKIPEIKDYTPNKIVFGTFNKFNKLSDEICKWWDDMFTEIERRYPALEVKFIMKGSFYTDYNNTILSKFSKNNQKKILILKKTKTYDEHLQLYKLMDISLDTFPYTGTTTTCESLWSGVPVITSYDNTKHVASVSSSILHHTGLGDWVVNDKQDFIELCSKWCGSLKELHQLKKGLHTRFMSSTMTDKAKFMKDYENSIENIFFANNK